MKVGQGEGEGGPLYTQVGTYVTVYGWKEMKMTKKTITAQLLATRTCHKDLSSKSLGLSEKRQYQGHEIGTSRRPHDCC